MVPQSSLPYSQAPATCPYLEPTPSSPHNPFPLLKIHLNIILPSTSRSPQWSLSLRFPHQNLVHTSPFLHTCNMLRPSHSSRFVFVVQNCEYSKQRKLLTMKDTIFRNMQSGYKYYRINIYKKSASCWFCLHNWIRCTVHTTSNYDRLLNQQTLVTVF